MSGLGPVGRDESEVIPLTFQETSDPSQFTNFAVPTRPLTAEESYVYRDLARRWAELDSLHQLRLYIAFLDTTGSDAVQGMFVDEIDRMRRRLDRFPDPENNALVKKLTDTLWNQDTAVLQGISLTAARKMEQIIERDFPQQLTLGQRLLACFMSAGR